MLVTYSGNPHEYLSHFFLEPEKMLTVICLARIGNAPQKMHVYISMLLTSPGRNLRVTWSILVLAHFGRSSSLHVGLGIAFKRLWEEFHMLVSSLVLAVAFP